MACYEKVIGNIRQLNELGELPNSIFTDDIVGVGADSGSPNIVQKMVSNKVVWHNTCRNSIDTQKVQRARKRSGPEVVISPVNNRRFSGESSTSFYKPVATPVGCIVSFVMKWVTSKSSERPPLLDWIRE